MTTTDDRESSATRRAAAWLGRALWGTLLALLLSLLFGFLVGLFLRSRLERPVHYIGATTPDERETQVVACVRGIDAQQESPIAQSARSRTCIV